MAGKTPLTESISRIERDASHQSKLEAHREHRIQKTLEHRETLNSHLEKTERRRTEALDKAQAARQDAYTRAGIAENPAVVSSEEKLRKHLDKSEQRRADALQHVHDRRAKLEHKTDKRIAKIEAKGDEAREDHTNDRELRHFDRDHRKEMRQPDHVESAKELQLRLAREEKSRHARRQKDNFSSSEEDGGGEQDNPAPRPGVFTVKTSSED